MNTSGHFLFFRLYLVVFWMPTLLGYLIDLWFWLLTSGELEGNLPVEFVFESIWTGRLNPSVQSRERILQLLNEGYDIIYIRCLSFFEKVDRIVNINNNVLKITQLKLIDYWRTNFHVNMFTVFVKKSYENIIREKNRLYLLTELNRESNKVL